MSSDIPRARDYIILAMEQGIMNPFARRCCTEALVLMKRSYPVRRAPPTRKRITPSQKRAVLALKHSDLTMHEIANRVGLANGGRVSEIMGHKR